MKRYKLLKHYPSLPKDWEINMIVGNGDDQWFTPKYSPENGNYKNYHVAAHEMLNTEYWEEITKSEYTILSFKEINDSSIANITKSGAYRIDEMYSNELGTDIGWMLNSCSWTIHSVRRESDGLILTVSDKCSSSMETDKIESFELRDNNIFVHLPRTYGFLKNIKKVKNPLFVTEDNVNVFDGNLEVYSVLTKSGWDERISTYDRYARALNGTAFTPESPWKHFYSKEAREEYIILNKPCLSLNDLNNNWVIEDFKVHGTKTFKKLKELVKTKL